MNPLLTVITPYWNRPEMLLGWVRACKSAWVPEVQHLIYFVNEQPPAWWRSEVGMAPIDMVYKEADPSLSIGHYHNLGAIQADTEWIMKLDVDTIPNRKFFAALIPVLRSAKEREWFNAGMIYLSRTATNRITIPVEDQVYKSVMSLPRAYTTAEGYFPQATNFICRKADYLKLGGCDERFRGYGWEDYQQIYVLERHQREEDPLPGAVGIENVTQRCRDEISRPKARELANKSQWLTLFHRWHGSSPDRNYKDREQMDKNRAIVLEHVHRARAER